MLPSFAVKNLHPFAFFFKQHLLNYLHTPKYSAQAETCHFKKFSRMNGGQAQTQPENESFLYTKAFTSGGKG